MDAVFAAIDLKSFYASVECHERNLDPLTTNLVVADQSRTEKTICLAVSPSLKSYGLPGRARLFEVIQKVREINAERLRYAPLGIFLGKSSNSIELQHNPNLALDYIIATPRMQYYIDYSSKIYNIYLQHLAPSDVFAYSIDEIFCDLTSYLKHSGKSAEDFVTDMITQVYQETSITATAGLGTNLFLAKVAMDILAKHTTPNSAGVRIAKLDESSFRQQLWAHRPITDFWRVGRGYTKRLATHNLHTMGDIARCSLTHPDLLYRLFGVNAELLIDHAWGYEPVNITDIKNHRPSSKSFSSGQVLSCPYNFSQAKTIMKEMAESLSLELVKKALVTNQIVLHIGYDKTSPNSSTNVENRYGQKVPKPAHGTYNLPITTSSTKIITDGFKKLYDQYVNPNFFIRRINLIANNLIPEDEMIEASEQLIQTNFFTNYYALEHKRQQLHDELLREKRAQKAILQIRDRYGNNAILRGTNFEDGATGRNRHRQIGGHRA